MTGPEKIPMVTKNIVEENIEKIRSMFPNCVTEAIEDGHIKRAIDFDKLRQELSSILIDGPKERYGLSWPDKRNSILIANTPTTKTLRPIRDKSIEYDKTKNIYIEGDNLEVLKTIRESYYGKIKMIYIDPPYNTGNDFLYHDDFKSSINDYLKKKQKLIMMEID